MIGVIVEGEGEIEAVRTYLSRVCTNESIMGRPYRADMQPKATPMVIAAAARSAVRCLVKNGATEVIVLIDLEDRPCPLSFASELRTAFARMFPETTIWPVIKDSCFENWMIADTEALRAMPKRFHKVDSIVRSIRRRGGADRCVAAIDLLDACAIKHEYHKRQDPPRIANYQCIERMASNSRSFRCFLSKLRHKPK